MRAQFQERKAERDNDGRNGGKEDTSRPDIAFSGKAIRMGKKNPQKARRALGRPQNTQEEGNSARIAANAPMSGKMAKMSDFRPQYARKCDPRLFGSGEGRMRPGSPFPAPQAPFRAPRPIFPQEGRKSSVIFLPHCLRAKVFYISRNVRIIFCRVF